MKKLLAVLLAFAMTMLFFPCSSLAEAETEPEFSGYDDPAYLAWLETTIATEMQADLGEGYEVVSVQAVYISEEYLEELEYNSAMNVFFGYTLDDLDAMFTGNRYVFTLSDDLDTTVQEFEPYDDSARIRNIMIGATVAAVIIVVVVVVVTNPATAPVVTKVCSVMKPIVANAKPVMHTVSRIRQVYSATSTVIRCINGEPNAITSTIETIETCSEYAYETWTTMVGISDD